MNNNLNNTVRTIEYSNLSDFNLKHIFECGQCFRWNEEVTNQAEEESNQACELEEDEAMIGVAGGYAARATLKGGGRTLLLETTGGSREFWSDYFDMNTNYGEIKSKLITNEPRIEKATERCYGIRILNQDFFEVLISFIISQNNNIPRIKKCIEGLAEKFGDPIGTAFGKERFLFPKAEVLAKLEEEDLASLKLGYRSAYIISAAKNYLENGIPSGNIDEKMEKLLSYHGIGPKVANCIMLFGLKEMSAFPIDVWVKKIMDDMYGFKENDTKGMQRFAEEKFGKLGGYAQQYLFYYYRG